MIIRILLAVLVLMLPAAGHTQTVDEGSMLLFSYFTGNGEDGLHLAYSADGLIWKPLNDGKSFLSPMVSTDRLMRDPSIVQGPDSLFHMVWTVSWTDRIIGYAHSKDLIEWSEQKAIPVMMHEPEARNTWAPELFYDPAAKNYLIFWATTIPGRFTETTGSSEDNYNHRIYYTMTRDFVTFTPTKPLYDPGFNSIDAVIVKDGARYVMFLKDETLNPPQKNIKTAFSDKADGPYSPASAPITGAYWAEGPTAIRIGDYWYVYFDRYSEGRYGAVRSKDMTTWEDISDTVSFPEGMRHGTAFRVTKATFDRLSPSR